MNFFSYFSSGAQEETKNPSPPSSPHASKSSTEPWPYNTPSPCCDDQIWSDRDSLTGNPKANLYSPPNLIIDKPAAPKSSLNTGFKIDPDKYIKQDIKDDLDFSEELNGKRMIDNLYNFT